MKPRLTSSRPLRVLFAAAELYPLIKTGGLGDAVGSLAQALRERGVDARVALPAYRAVVEQFNGAQAAPGPAGADYGIKPTEIVLEANRTRVYLIGGEGFSDRPGNPYMGPDGRDWPDNALRFGSFSQAVVALARGKSGSAWQPDIVHCHDWHSGLVPALLAGVRERPATVFNIHSLAYQGLFPYAEFERLRLPRRLWSPDGLEFHGQLSFIKGGLAFADRLVTVSPTYAREILTPEQGCGLDGLLQKRKQDLRGILNGVDYTVWDPRNDTHIARAYSSENTGPKLVNKHALQRKFGLPARDDVFMLGYVGRLTDQKGVDLICAALDRMIGGQRLQIVVLGSGDQILEQRLQHAAQVYPAQVGVHLGYSEALAHQIIAGADAFLMPSRFEPCGLTQLYSLRYGTVPIVHSTGGLIDTVVDATDCNLASGRATGFRFDKLSGLTATVARAARVFRKTPERWQVLMRQGMIQDFAWSNGAQKYLELYHDVLQRDVAGR